VISYHGFSSKFAKFAFTCNLHRSDEGRDGAKEHIQNWRRGELFEDKLAERDELGASGRSGGGGEGRGGGGEGGGEGSGEAGTEGGRVEESLQHRKRQLRMRRNAEIALKEGRDAFRTPPKERDEQQVEGCSLPGGVQLFTWIIWIILNARRRVQGSPQVDSARNTPA
jgi:hypothetical protein